MRISVKGIRRKAGEQVARPTGGGQAARQSLCAVLVVYCSLEALHPARLVSALQQCRDKANTEGKTYAFGIGQHVVGLGNGAEQLLCLFTIAWIFVRMSLQRILAIAVQSSPGACAGRYHE